MVEEVGVGDTVDGGVDGDGEEDEGGDVFESAFVSIRGIGCFWVGG